jgi:hypothetical protein
MKILKRTRSCGRKPAATAAKIGSSLRDRVAVFSRDGSGFNTMSSGSLRGVTLRDNNFTRLERTDRPAALAQGCSGWKVHAPLHFLPFLISDLNQEKWVGICESPSFNDTLYFNLTVLMEDRRSRVVSVGRCGKKHRGHD